MKAAHEKRVATSVLDVVSSSSRRRSVNVLFEIFFVGSLEGSEVTESVIRAVQLDAHRCFSFAVRRVSNQRVCRSLLSATQWRSFSLRLLQKFFVAFKLARIAHCTTAEVHSSRCCGKSFQTASGFCRRSIAGGIGLPSSSSVYHFRIGGSLELAYECLYMHLHIACAFARVHNIVCVGVEYMLISNMHRALIIF